MYRSVDPPIKKHRHYIILLLLDTAEPKVAIYGAINGLMGFPRQRNIINLLFELIFQQFQKSDTFTKKYLKKIIGK